MSTQHAFEFLAESGEAAQGAGPWIVLFGDDRFLQLLVRRKLLDVLAPGEAEFSTVIMDGELATWSDVIDEIDSTSLFGGGGGRIVVLDNGDAFVRRFRSELETLAEQNNRSGGRLILMVTTWPANTRLYKLASQSGFQVQCSEPVSRRGSSKSRDTGAIVKWLVHRAEATHALRLTQTLARQILDIVDWNLGRADQELAKLALYDGPVTEARIADVVGGWRAQSIWDCAMAAAQGKTAVALDHLANLTAAGEHPLALYGQLSWSLRRFGRLWELVSHQARTGRKPDLSVALSHAGFRNWGGELSQAEEAVKQLTRQRVRQIYGWLLQTDLALKGSHSDATRGRLALERLFFLMAEGGAGHAGPE